MTVVLLFLVLALLLGGLLGLLMARDPGYVLLAWDGISVETSIWFGLLVLLLAWVAAAGLLRLVRRLAGSGGNVRGWLAARRQGNAGRRFNQGLLLAAEGRWRDARTAFVSAARAEGSLAGYLNAARAAHEIGDDAERDEMLRLAGESEPGAAVAAGLVRASLQQKRGDWKQSLATVLELRRQAPRHPLVLTMIFRAHRALGDIEALEEVLADADRAGLAAPDEIDDAHRAIFLGRLARAAASADAAEHAAALWQRTPAGTRAEEDVLLEYVAVLERAGDAVTAEAALRTGIESDFRQRWVRRYGAVHADPAMQISVAERWLQSRPDDAALLETLGRLHLAARERDAATRYLVRAAEAGAAE